MEQRQEIIAMRLALDQLPPPSTPDSGQQTAPTSVPAPATRMSHDDAQMHMQLYHGQVLVHGMGYSPDHRTIAVVSIGSNSVSFIATQTNAVKHVAYVGRSPHEAFFTPDGNDVWVTVHEENYVAVLDGKTFEEKSRILVPAGPGV